MNLPKQKLESLREIAEKAKSNTLTMVWTPFYSAFSPDVALALIDIVQAKKILDYALIREALYALENGDQYSKVLAIKHLKEALEGASE